MVDKMKRENMAADYGFAMAFLNSNPELRKLFGEAVRKTWTPQMFVAQLRGTKWFKNHSASVRNAIMQQTADPATYKANVDQMFATVRDSYGAMFGTAGMSKKQMRGWAETAHRMGWSEAQLVDRMTDNINFRKMLRKNQLGGTAAELNGQVESMLQNYGINLGPKWRARQIDKVMSGNDTAAGVQQRVKELAMREYKAFADRIAGGETVADIAEPYVQKMAELLELNPNDVGLHTKKIQAALKQHDADGKPAAMDLYEFERHVRRDARWQYTKNAKEEVGALTQGLLSKMGLVAN